MADDTANKSEPTLLQKAGGVLVDFAEWLGDKLGHDRALQALADDLGLDLKQTPTFPKTFDVAKIKAYIADPNPDLEAWIGVIADIQKLVDSVMSIRDAFDLGAEATADEIGTSIVDLLASNYVRERWFHLFTIMELTRFSTEPMTLFGPHGTAGQRFYGSLKALIKFALGPVAALCEHPLETEADARKLSDETLLHLAAVFAFVGSSAREIGLDFAPEDQHRFRMMYGWDTPAAALSAAQIANPTADQVSERMLSMQVRKNQSLFQNDEISVEGALRFSLAWVPAEHGGPGLFVSIGGSTFRFNVDRKAAAWTTQAEARFDAPFSMQLGGKTDNFRIDSALAEGAIHLDAAIASKPMPPGERRFRISLGKDNEFAIGRIALSGSLDRDDARVQISFYDCRLALDGTSFDDFIGSLLPTKQTSVEFSVGAGVSTRDGLFLTGDLSTPAAASAAPAKTPTQPATLLPADTSATPAV